VVIQGDGVPFEQISADRLPLVTQWGQDPLWDSALANTQARVADFPAAVRSEMALLQEDGTGVQVVGHRVHFDPARKLWYCDIEINPGAGYMPFVRLALVRFQPNALPGAKISRVVLAEFAQVLPRRRAVLVRDGNALNVNVYGPASNRGPMRRFNPGGGAESEFANLSLSQPGGPDGRNRMELVLQMQDAGVESDLGWDDLAQLASGLVGGPAGTRSASAPLPEGVHLQRGDDTLKLRTRRGDTLRLDRLVQRDGLGNGGVQLGTGGPGSIGVQPGPGSGGLTGGGAVVVQPPAFAEPAVWTQTAQLPRLPARRALRLVLREFERFYTDRTVPETVGSSVGRRVVVEERLVYAEVFALD
jgi:hypothetical protein